MKKQRSTENALPSKGRGLVKRQKIIRKALTFNISDHHEVSITVSANKEGWLVLRHDVDLGARFLREAIADAFRGKRRLLKNSNRKEFRVHVASAFAYFYSCLQQGASRWPLHFRQFLKFMEKHCGKLVGIKSGADKDRHNFAIKMTIFGVYGIGPDEEITNYAGNGRWLILRDPNQSFNYVVFRQQYITRENLLVTNACMVAKNLLSRDIAEMSCSDEITPHDVNLEQIDGDYKPADAFIKRIEDNLREEIPSS